MLTNSTEQFPLTETPYVTVRLMQEFTSLESRDPEPWRELFKLTCTGLGGYKASPALKTVPLKSPFATACIETMFWL